MAVRCSAKAVSFDLVLGGGRVFVVGQLLFAELIAAVIGLIRLAALEVVRVGVGVVALVRVVSAAGLARLVLGHRPRGHDRLIVVVIGLLVVCHAQSPSPL